MPLKLKKNPNGGPLLPDVPFHFQTDQWEESLAQQTGCGSPESAQRFLKDFLPAMGLSKDSSINDINGALAALIASAPQDPLECQIIAQALVCSHHAMKLVSKAGPDCSTELQQHWMNLATRLMRLNAQQLEAIGKYRRNGEQRLFIERVDISTGGQALIGSINHLQHQQAIRG